MFPTNTTLNLLVFLSNPFLRLFNWFEVIELYCDDFSVNSNELHYSTHFCQYYCQYLNSFWNIFESARDWKSYLRKRVWDSNKVVHTSEWQFVFVLLWCQCRKDWNRKSAVFIRVIVVHCLCNCLTLASPSLFCLLCPFLWSFIIYRTQRWNYPEDAQQIHH